MKTLSALTVRREFGSVLDEVVRKNEPVTITRANKPLVVLVPAASYGGANAGRIRESRLRRADERVAEWRRRHAARLRGLDPVELVRESRSRR